MEFHFDRVQLGNTFDAHRVAQAARGTPVEEAVVKGLFGAYFTEGSLLSDHQTLEQTATAAGLDSDLVRGVLAGDAHAGDVRADESAARELGVTGVPHFVINGAWAIPGAQDVDTLVTVLRRAWERTEV
jgi:predicted DsbA family dithiol-disulfide isomerase